MKDFSDVKVDVSLTILESVTIFVAKAVLKKVATGVHSSIFQDYPFNPLNKHWDLCVHVMSFSLQKQIYERLEVLVDLSVPKNDGRWLLHHH